MQHSDVQYTDVADLVADAAQEAPDRLALVEATGRSRTWAELETDVAAFASGLSRLELTAGRRVMLVLGNRIEFVAAYLGTLRAQIIAVPVNPRSTVEELARLIADSGSRVVVAEAATLTAVREACAIAAAARAGAPTELDPEIAARAHRPRIVVLDEPARGPDETAYDELMAGPARSVPSLPDPEKLAALLYTSGASGRPRAAMLTHRAMLANIEQVAAVEPPMIDGDDVVLGVLPLFHVYGLNAVLGSVLRHRAKLLLVRSWDPQEVLDLIEDEAVSVLPVAPPVFAHWRAVEDLAERLGPVRLILSGSAPLGLEDIETFQAIVNVPIHQGYGLTEASPVVTSTLCSSTLKHGSVGAALPGVEIRLVDDVGSPVAGDDPGEIQVRGANLFSGYWPAGDLAPDSEGWWATGDVGFLDNDGDLFLVDRLKDVIIVSGFNVYPTEVEEVIRDVEGVREVAVIGAPDEHTGEAVVAYVVARDGAAQGEDLAARVREAIETRLARFKQPTRIVMVDRLPLTVTGKVQKGRLRGLERRRALGLID